MSLWKCLRDCYTYDRFHYAGREYEFPDKLVKNPKNFAPMGDPKSETVSSSVVLVMDPPVVTEPVAKVKRVCKCSVCGKVVRSALGLSAHSRSHKKEATNVNSNS